MLAGRYKALMVDGSGDGYLRTVCDYVHLNPVRANLLKPEEPLERFEWSSYGCYLKAPALRPTWLRVERLLGEHGIRLRQETTMSLKWIAQRLQMGSWTYVSNLLNGAILAATRNQTNQPQLPLYQ